MDFLCAFFKQLKEVASTKLHFNYLMGTWGLTV